MAHAGIRYPDRSSTRYRTLVSIDPLPSRAHLLLTLTELLSQSTRMVTEPVRIVMDELITEGRLMGLTAKEFREHYGVEINGVKQPDPRLVDINEQWISRRLSALGCEMTRTGRADGRRIVITATPTA